MSLMMAVRFTGRRSSLGPGDQHVSGWFPTKEFWIPEGTEYSGEISIRKDSKKKTCPGNPDLSGYHYQLEPRTRMMVQAFKGALDNMARAAVARQCALAKVKN